MKIPVVENVLKVNDEIAAMNRKELCDAGVFTIDLMGAPGCGKTSLLEATLKHFADKLEIGVMVGDLTTVRDAQRMGRYAEQVIQINTGRGCHLDANQVRNAMSRMELNKLDILVIENVGNLICPVGFDLGQNVKVGMFSVTEGDDKAAKHPYIVHESGVLLLNKFDLFEHVTFNLDTFRADLKQLNNSVDLFEISVAENNLAQWFAWVEQNAHSTSQS